MPFAERQSWHFVSAPQLMFINDLQGCVGPELPANSSQNERQPLSKAGPDHSVVYGLVVLDPPLVTQSVPGPVDFFKSLPGKLFPYLRQLQKTSY